jgi:O-antigen/teichoic acid export membrane protein
MNKKIARNGLWLSGSQLFSRAIGFLFYIFIARKLSVENFGIYTFTLAFVFNFIPVADFGIERLILKDVSKDTSKANEYFNKLFILRFLLAIVSIVLFILFGVALGQNLTQILYFLIFGIYIIPLNLIYLITSIQNAREKMKTIALANILGIVFSTTIGVFFLIFKFSLPFVLSSFFLGNSIVLIIFLFNLKKFNLSFSIKTDWEFWKKILLESWVFALLTIISVFYLRTSVVMLNLIKGSVATGLFGSVFRLLEGMTIIPQSLAIAMFPLSSRLYDSDKGKLKNIYLKGLLFLFVSSLPFSSVFIFFPDILIKYSFGIKYLPVVEIMPYLGIGTILFFVNALAGNIIQNSPKVKKFIPFLFLNLIFEVILCMILIPKFSILGSALAVIGGEVFGLFINNIFVWKILHEKNI